MITISEWWYLFSGILVWEVWVRVYCAIPDLDLGGFLAIVLKVLVPHDFLMSLPPLPTLLLGAARCSIFSAAVVVFRGSLFSPFASFICLPIFIFYFRG